MHITQNDNAIKTQRAWWMAKVTVDVERKDMDYILWKNRDKGNFYFPFNTH
jgi:hypothetical protein